MKDLAFLRISQEEGTVAGEMKNQVGESLKNQRRDGIMLHQMEISRDQNHQKIGMTLEVIIDEIEKEYPLERGMEKENIYIGRTQYDAPEIDHTVVVQSDLLHQPGDFIQVKITDGFDYDIVGVEV